MESQKIRIRLKAYDHYSLDRSTKAITQTVLRTGARIAGPIPLRTLLPDMGMVLPIDKAVIFLR